MRAGPKYATLERVEEEAAVVRTVLLCLSLFALLGCSDVPRAWSRSDVQEIARDAAEDAQRSESDANVAELAVKVAELEAQLQRLEKEQAADIQMLQKITSANVTDGKWSDEAFDRLFKNDETLRQNVNWLLARQGRQPVPRVD